MTIVLIDAKPGDDAEICVKFDKVKTTKKIGKATEVQAKYNALIQALSMLATERASSVTVYLDNEYIVKTMNEECKINGKYPSHKLLNERAIKLKKKIKNFKIKLISTKQLKKQLN